MAALDGHLFSTFEVTLKKGEHHQYAHSALSVLAK